MCVCVCVMTANVILNKLVDGMEKKQKNAKYKYG